jgi:hypothetical protein
MLKNLKAVNKLEKKAFLLGVMLLVGLAALGFTGLARADQAGPMRIVLIVDNPNVSCESPVPGLKDEGQLGQLGQTITVSAEDPIDFVTVKSNPDAEVVSAQFDTFEGQITLSKNITGYIVWTCPPTTTTSPTSTTEASTSTTLISTTTTEPATSTTSSPTTTASPTSTSA